MLPGNPVTTSHTSRLSHIVNLQRNVTLTVVAAVPQACTGMSMNVITMIDQVLRLDRSELEMKIGDPVDLPEMKWKKMTGDALLSLLGLLPWRTVINHTVQNIDVPM